MNHCVHFTAPVRRWAGTNGGSWFLVTVEGQPAEEISGHALMRRLEEGRRRGFGSVKVLARLGETSWATSVFPQRNGQWVMLLKAQVRRAENVGEGDEIDLALELL